MTRFNVPAPARRFYSAASMAVTPGSRLGPYEITAPLGAAGTDEVRRGCESPTDIAVASGDSRRSSRYVSGEIEAPIRRSRKRRDVMKKRSLGIVAVMVVMLGVASVAALAGLGGNEGPAQNLEVKGPPPGGGCVCPANWEPVLCTASDGSRHAFSNGCVAGCYGYTNCAQIVAAP
jgi:hypothetical protein